MKVVDDAKFVKFNLGDVFNDNAQIVFNHIGEKRKINEVAGEAIINLPGIKDILRRKDYKYTAALIDAIPSTIEKGLVINGELNHKNRNYNTVILAAKVEFTNAFDENHKAGEYYMAVVLKRSRNDKGEIYQRLHVVDAEIVPTKKEPYYTARVTKNSNAQIQEKALNLRGILNQLAAGVNIYKNNDSSEKVNYSLDTDSTGKKLSEGQQKLLNDAPFLMGHSGNGLFCHKNILLD